MASMLAELREMVSPELIAAITRQTHESDVAVTKASHAVIPVFAATIANRSDEPGFMNEFVNLATSVADSDPVATAMRLASSPSAIDMTTPGWLATMFGNNLVSVTNSLTRYAGIRASTASSMLMAFAPIVLGYFGGLIRRHNLSATALGERMRAERPHIESAVPAGFEMPGIHQPYQATRELVDETTPDPAARHETWTLPIAALVAALCLMGVVWWEMASSKYSVPVSDTTPVATGTTGTLLSRPFPEQSRFAFPSGSAEDRLSKYLASTGSGSMKVDLDRIGFGMGSATLTPPSQTQIDDIATILREYPNATVTVAGYTDDLGNEQANLALSLARAETVAKALINAGVNADRVHADGYGSQKPVADNSTARGRARNRRVTLEVSPE
ncbi:MAG TPA: OmpA family protein [Vicinamibacterales bacterium]|nr:OmpA family protein [Vicinamibacterales bacterium]